MDTQNLLDQYFETAFSAPDGIKHLRELILTLAMRGRLVPQDSSDQPARELLKDIEVEKQRLIREGKLKKQKPLPQIKPEEIPYELPESWEWVRLGNCIMFTNGFAFKSSLFQDQGIGVVKIGDIADGEIVTTKMSFVDQSVLNEIDSKFQIHYDDLLIAMSGATTGKLGFNKKKEIFLLNQRVGKIQSICIDKNFLYNFLSTQIQKNLSISSGSAIPNLSTEQIENTLIPLPPLTEQKRLVEKIDSLIEQCDQLERLRREKEQKRILIHTGAREKLLGAVDRETFGQAWDFIQKNFGELYAVKENVASLRQAILQLAVMGKLVPQDPNDPPASELLKEIEAEKQRLIKEGKLKKQKPLPAIKADEIPYDLPKSWKWVRFNDITQLQNGFAFKSIEYTLTGIKLIRNINISHGFIDHEEIAYYPDFLRPNFLEFELFEGDIVLSLDRPIISSGLKIAILKNEDVPSLLVQRVARVRSELLKCNKYYLMAWFNSFLFIKNINPGRSKGVPHISTKQVEGLCFPLPPLPEQRRIVAKVDALTALCDQLESKIDRQTAQQTQLLEAVMARI